MRWTGSLSVVLMCFCAQTWARAETSYKRSMVSQVTGERHFDVSDSLPPLVIYRNCINNKIRAGDLEIWGAHLNSAARFYVHVAQSKVQHISPAVNPGNVQKTVLDRCWLVLDHFEVCSLLTAKFTRSIKSTQQESDSCDWYIVLYDIIVISL